MFLKENIQFIIRILFYKDKLVIIKNNYKPLYSNIHFFTTEFIRRGKNHHNCKL